MSKSQISIKSVELHPIEGMARCSEVIGVPIRTLQSWAAAGKFKAKKTGRTWRVNTASLLEYLGLTAD